MATAEPMLPVFGASPAMCTLRRAIADIAPTDIPVLLLGECGTGKETVAREIHRLSAQSAGPFIKFNCAVEAPDALTTHLRARSSRAGTLLLDEINQLAPESQNHLLHLLLDGETAAPTGGVRIISTTAVRLEEEARRGTFRRQLYYRLSGLQLRLPPLRERQEDIPELLECLMRRHAGLMGRPVPGLRPATMDRLLAHSWPGNVRELENVARKLVALGDEQVALADLTVAAPPSGPAGVPPTRAVAVPMSLKEAAREASRKAERELIAASLERTRWNRKRTARELQISYKALLYKLKQLGLEAREAEALPPDLRRNGS